MSIPEVQIVLPSWIDSIHGYPVLNAFAEGLFKLGVYFEFRRDIENSGPLPRAMPSVDTTLVCWGIFKKKFAVQRTSFLNLQQTQKAIGGKLIIIERGFVKREDYYVVSFDDLNGRGRYPHDFSCPGDRWEKLGVKVLPWNTGDEHLVIGQVPWDTSCQHFNHAKWVRNTIIAIRANDPAGRIVFRPHPLQPRAIGFEKIPRCSVDIDRPLSEALERAKTVYTFSSTVGVDATVRGSHVTVTDPISMAYKLWRSEAGEPDRQPWVNWLAYCQWTMEEMREGLPWLHLHSEE